MSLKNRTESRRSIGADTLSADTCKREPRIFFLSVSFRASYILIMLRDTTGVIEGGEQAGGICLLKLGENIFGQISCKNQAVDISVNLGLWLYLYVILRSTVMENQMTEIVDILEEERTDSRQPLFLTVFCNYCSFLFYVYVKYSFEF